MTVIPARPKRHKPEDLTGLHKRLGDMRKMWRHATRRSSAGATRSSCRAISSRPWARSDDHAIRRIALSGSVSVRQLLDAGLLDELHLFVHPATAGSG